MTKIDPLTPTIPNLVNDLGSSFLVSPCDRYEESFLAGAREFEGEDRLDSTYAGALGYNIRQLQRNVAAFIMDLKQLADKSRIREFGYCDKVFWLIDREEYIGQASLRPDLGTSYLVTYGGHIGYSIRPSKRRCGYGMRILSLVLAKASGANLSKVLVTCDSDNAASKKIIERNGGVFESAMPMRGNILGIEGRKHGEEVDKLRYWIDLPEARRGRAL